MSYSVSTRSSLRASDDLNFARVGDVEFHVFDGGKQTLSFRIEAGTTTPILLARDFRSSTGTLYAVDAYPVVAGVPEDLSTHWLTSDRQGNVRDSYRFGFDAKGNVAAYSFERFDYDDWGRPQALGTPSGHESLFGVDPALLRQFQGAFYDRDLKAYKFGDRWLKPSLGRWLGEDPSGLRYGTNPSAALGNSPANYRDPTGHWAEAILFEIPSLALGYFSLQDSVARGDVTGAIVDSAGIAADVVALALPFIPGGAGAAIKAARAAATFGDARLACSRDVARSTR